MWSLVPSFDETAGNGMGSKDLGSESEATLCNVFLRQLPNQSTLKVVQTNHCLPCGSRFSSVVFFKASTGRDIGMDMDVTLTARKPKKNQPI